MPDPDPSAILTEEEWEAVLVEYSEAALDDHDASTSDDDPETLHLAAVEESLRAHDAALRARVAASDALLRQINVAHEAADRCQCEMFMDCQHARLQREAREALRAHLGAAP